MAGRGPREVGMAAEMSQAIGNACVADVQRFGWQSPEMD